MQNQKHLLSSVYEKYVDSLFSYGCKFTGDRETIKDCIHDVFVKLYEKEEIISIRNLKYYLLRMLRNRISDKLTEMQRWHELDENGFSLLQPSGEDCYIEDEKTVQMKQYMEKLFEHLTGKQKEAVYLHFMEKMDYDDIGQLLGMNHQSVKNLVHRALLRLRERMGDKPSFILLLLIHRAIR
ncbi:MAG: sigma-70 family RNA polymerase sigma factor [Bacteroidales bacterium]|jgi:RNA polymerase sigma factor (sigma-70 family)|nr:sigma-70 family RNA polymerase sigma factor [Bacteroidales bacterium]